MKKIFSSPSSIVFITLAVAVCVFTYRGTVESKDFVMLVTMAFMHYFKRPEAVPEPVKPVEEQLG